MRRDSVHIINTTAPHNICVPTTKQAYFLLCADDYRGKHRAA